MYPDGVSSRKGWSLRTYRGGSRASIRPGVVRGEIVWRTPLSPQRGMVAQRHQLAVNDGPCDSSSEATDVTYYLKPHIFTLAPEMRVMSGLWLYLTSKGVLGRQGGAIVSAQPSLERLR